MKVERLLGLIGHPLSHSFSKGYFSKKFIEESIEGYYYELFPISSIDQFPTLIQQYPNLVGLNVTVPYKELVIPYLDALDDSAAAVNAVNVIQVKSGKLMGYNSDVYGFGESLRKFLSDKNRLVEKPGALVLGTGGAAKAVMYALQTLDIDYLAVSRSVAKGDITYNQLSQEHYEAYPLLINTTPLGMSPNYSSCPAINYAFINEKHLLYDLVYNPDQTKFMQLGQAKGAQCKNGLEMLHLQAEKSWEIWNTDNDNVKF